MVGPQVGFVTYFKSGWNIFDAIVVVVSIAGVALDYGTTQNLTFMPLLRIMRVVRIFKLIPKAKGLRTLMQTLLWSLPALLNVGTSECSAQELSSSSCLTAYVDAYWVPVACWHDLGRPV
jgi:hypothetical protein